jgi:outer membrane murein-binding lipoprotein Lpp
MSNEGDNVVIPPPPKGDASGGKTTPIDGASRDSHVEQLSSEVKKVKLQRKIDKLKKKLKDSKSQDSSSNEEANASSEEEARGEKGRKGDKRSYNTTSFSYGNLPPSSTFTSLPICKAPCFDGMDYTKWRYSMKMHLISFNSSVWTIVCIGVDFLNEDEELGFEQLQQIHRTNQASSVLPILIGKE